MALAWLRVGALGLVAVVPRPPGRTPRDVVLVVRLPLVDARPLVVGLGRRMMVVGLGRVDVVGRRPLVDARPLVAVGLGRD